MKDLGNSELVETLRAMADFYESHPEAPIPMDMRYGWMRCYVTSANAKAVLRSLGSFTKKFEDTKFVAQVPVGHITLDFVMERDQVCERKVIGTKTVPLQVIPASFSPEQVIAEHEEEVVEWDCHPVMEPEVPSPDQVAQERTLAAIEGEIGRTKADMAILRDDEIPF